MTSDRVAGRLGRHGTAQPQPWHPVWFDLREALNLMVRMQRAEDETTRNALAVQLADASAARAYATPGLGEHERGYWISATVRQAIEALYARFHIPVPNDAADQQAILFWYLAVRHGYGQPEIARDLATYVVQPNTRSRKQWVADRMWGTGNRPHAKAGDGLAELTRQVHLRLATSIPSGGSAEAAKELVREALDRLFLEDPATASWMAVLAHFAPDPIPLEPLAIEVPRGLPHVKGRLDLLPLEEYVERLMSVGLVRRLDEGSFAVPSTIATATLAYLDDALRQRALRAAIVLISMAFPWEASNQDRWSVSEVLVSHVLAVASLAESLPRGREDAATLFKYATNYYRSRALLDEAIVAGRRAVAAAELACGTRSPKLTGPLGNLAHALMDNGELIEAEAAFARVLALEEDEASTSPVERAQTLNLYGNLLRRMRRLGEAEDAQRRAFQLLAEDERPLLFSRIANDLALTLLYQERQAEALSMFRLALTGLDGADGTRIVKKNIGQTLFELGELDEARQILEETLAEQEAMPIPDEGFMAAVLQSLAQVYRTLGDDVRADEAYARLATLDQPWVT